MSTPENASAADQPADKKPKPASKERPRIKSRPDAVKKPATPLEPQKKEHKKGTQAVGKTPDSTPYTPPPEAPPVVSLENFDWDAFDRQGFGEGYSKKDREEMTSLYSGTITSVAEGEVVEGVVIGINDRDVILNIGFKSDGLVPRAEFKDLPDIKIGDQVDLFVEMREDAMGQLVLSRKKAKLVKSWNTVQDALEKGTVMECLVKRRTKGGLIADLCGIEAFLPGSQIDVKTIRDFNIYVDKTIEVKVVKINHLNNNIVVSHKILIEKDIEEQKLAILNNLEKGQVLEGAIKNMTNFGVFIDLGGVDGLLHITDIAWERVNHPSELLKLDQVVKVVVLNFDESKKRISLGMKQLVPHPWNSLAADIDVQSKVKGKVTNVVDYGAFLEIQPGVEGLIHVSEMSWSQHLRNPQDFMKVDDEIEAVVLTIDREDRKMSLGIKQLRQDPWTSDEMMTKYAVGTKHTGIVRNLTNFGLFVELEEGIDGLVHVSDLSWSKNIKHPYEFTKVGNSLEVMVLELEIPLRRLSLSHKHMEDNPWETFESIFLVGSVHKCVVLDKNDKGSTLELPYGVETFCHASNLTKQDGSQPSVGETVECKVASFSLAERRIIMNHKDLWAEKPSEPTKKTTKAPAKEKASKPTKKKAVEKQEKVEDTKNQESLRELKKKMISKEQKPEDGKKE